MPTMPPTFGSNRPKFKQVQTHKSPYGSDWRKLRKRRLDAEPLCRHCADKGLVTPAKQVDHILAVGLGGKNEWNNTQSLCIPCHKLKTADDIRRMGSGL